MKKQPPPRIQPRKAWAIVMRGGIVDEISLNRKYLNPLPEEHLVRVQIVPVKKRRKSA